MLASKKGFTLLEVLVAIGLLAFLSLGIFSLTTNSWDVNSKLSAESADVTSMLLSLQAVETDLEQIYTPRLGALTAKPEDTNKISDYWSPPLRSDGFRRSRFKGDANKLSFVTNNNRRVEADSPESDFMKVAWEVERNAKGTYTLYRTRDTDAFRYEDGSAKKPERVALIENLSSAKFQYYRLMDKSWQDTWDSEGSYQKEETRFPDLIKLKVEAPDPQNNANQLAWETVIRPNAQLNYLDSATRTQRKNLTE
jgi:type II secretion system protein J